MENNQLNRLAESLRLTNFEEEQEPYILTPEEEQYIISGAILDKVKHMTWKMKGMGYSDQAILQRIAGKFDKELDKDAILKRANSNKNYEVWQSQQREKEKQAAIDKQKELEALWSAKSIFSLMKWTSDKVYSKPLIVNDDNKKFISTICFFLSGDERFETELGYSFKKGLLIRGISGVGKTHIVQCVAKNELNPILILSMIEISESIREEGEYKIDRGENKIIYLDDVGTEEATVNHFGTKINYFKTFIEKMYLKNTTFNQLIISTNNSFQEIEEKYGFRVRSRMKDMFNIVDVKGNDMRG
jgi:DNA replication protein DnaC